MSLAHRCLVRLATALLCAVVAVSGFQLARAGGLFNTPQVGGILINADGVILEPTVDDTGRTRDMRRKLVARAAGEMALPSGLRMISLRRLQETIVEHQRQVKPLPTEVKVLAGLQRIQYVFLYPEDNDIVLAGPGEGWQINERGQVVGETTGRPVILLDDLLVALRATSAAAETGVSCSIDPTQEGIERYNQFMSQQRTFTAAAAKGAEQALGMQKITVTGIPATSHFARVMVAADYRMKRLAMAIDRTPVKEVPSYLQMASTRGVGNQFPRWWLSTNYDGVQRDEEGLAWELRGSGVKAMTEDEVIGKDGSRTRTGKASETAQKWADLMTNHYDALSVKEPIFGELRNLMDLSVIAALISKEGLAEKAGCDLSFLLDEKQLEAEVMEAPKQVPTIASVVKKGRSYMISASGGVEIPSWEVAEKVEVKVELSDTHQQAAPKEVKSWWWNG